MADVPSTSENISKRVPWNKGKIVGHTKIESTVRYLGIEVDDALAIAEQVDV